MRNLYLYNRDHWLGMQKKKFFLDHPRKGNRLACKKKNHIMADTK